MVGLAQVLALIPGVSRSGSHLPRHCWMAGSGPMPPGFLSPRHSGDHHPGIVELRMPGCDVDAGPLPLLVGILAATVVSWLAIDWLLEFLQRHSTWLFVVYRLLFGLGLVAGGPFTAHTDSNPSSVQPLWNEPSAGVAVSALNHDAVARQPLPAVVDGGARPIGEGLGFEPGDQLLSINGIRPRDQLITAISASKKTCT